MSNDSSNVPTLTEKQKASTSYVSQWTLENDYPGNSPVYTSARQPARPAVNTPGSGEIAKYESYGKDGIRGPSYPMPTHDAI